MEYTIEGEIAQCVNLTMDQGESLWASKGGLMAHQEGVRWTLKIPGGMKGVVKRSLSGEGIGLMFMECDKPGRRVGLAANQPGHIIEWNLSDGPVLTTRGSFLAAWGESVDISVTVAKRVGAAFFGGAGLFLQRISGSGTVLVHGSGDFQDIRLAEGEEILVSTGHLAAFANEVDYGIQGVAGCRRVLFGGEGLFMTRLRGPGRVLLQTLKRQAGGARSAQM